MTKFMQMIDPLVFAELESVAEVKGISVQELIRAIIIPEWLKMQRNRMIEPIPNSETVFSSTPDLG